MLQHVIVLFGMEIHITHLVFIMIIMYLDLIQIHVNLNGQGDYISNSLMLL